MEADMKREKSKAKAGAKHQKRSAFIAEVPEAMRPTVPGYEFSTKKTDLLPWKWAAKRLTKSQQYWIATARPDGSPHLMIIWGLWFEDSFWFSTGTKSRKARNIAQNPRCVIGTDDAAKAVILEGMVELIDPQHPEFENFARTYEKKYKWDLRKMVQVVYRLRPSIGFGLYERKFDQTATRWVFRERRASQ
jgi:pyridoxamine 5'-phosphate oxidase-like protein